MQCTLYKWCRECEEPAPAPALLTMHGSYNVRANHSSEFSGFHLSAFFMFSHVYLRTLVKCRLILTCF